jgi:hypothetical protein
MRTTSLCFFPLLDNGGDEADAGEMSSITSNNTSPALKNAAWPNFRMTSACTILDKLLYEMSKNMRLSKGGKSSGTSRSMNCRTSQAVAPTPTSTTPVAPLRSHSRTRKGYPVPRAPLRHRWRRTSSQTRSMTRDVCLDGRTEARCRGSCRRRRLFEVTTCARTRTRDRHRGRSWRARW